MGSSTSTTWPRWRFAKKLSKLKKAKSTAPPARSGKTVRIDTSLPDAKVIGGTNATIYVSSVEPSTFSHVIGDYALMASYGSSYVAKLPGLEVLGSYPHGGGLGLTELRVLSCGLRFDDLAGRARDAVDPRVDHHVDRPTTRDGCRLARRI